MSIFGFGRGHIRAYVIVGLILLISAAVVAQVPSPRSVLGFAPAADRTIADWRQMTDYFARLDRASDRVAVREIGKTTLGKPIITAFISSERNIKDLDKYRRINAKLADPRTIKDQNEVEDLVRSGKTIVAISCSIHSTEIVASQMSMELAYGLAAANDPGTKEILDNTILLLIPSANPDGIDIVADWYRKTLGTKSEGTSPPELYHHYAGHDNNRDWFMMNLAETRAITKLFWQEWFPHVVYDVHQQGQNASRIVLPPFFDPPNPRISPTILRDAGLIGYKMAADLQVRGVKGVATNSTFDTWWHGGFRSAPYFHNSIGILSEVASAALMSPVTIKREELARGRVTRGLPDLLTPATNYPDPWQGGEWRAADIAQIELVASRSLLEMAAKFRERYLRNFYKLGSENLVPKNGDPRAFIISGGQPNAETISRLVEILMWQGIEIHQMTNELYVKMLPSDRDFHEMPLGSFLIYVDQPQRNNILSLFERQVYPDRRLPNGDAEAPYDVAGWTLPMQMGIESDAAWEIRDLEKERRTIKRIETLDQARTLLNLTPSNGSFAKKPFPLRSKPKVGLYRGSAPSMDEGWMRFVFDTFQIPFRSVTDAEIRAGISDIDVLVLPADREATIVNGLDPEKYPAQFAGGIGSEGVENLKRFVDDGGRLVCFDDSCEMVIKQFELPIKNVLSPLRRNEFYNPGSIVELNILDRKGLGRGTPPTLPAYFASSSAFEVIDKKRISTAATYAQTDALLSGWMVGEKYLNGKTALAETKYGKGSIVLFAFRPQHRGQSWGTFPLIFNSLEMKEL